jgi:hypothetical protein
MLYGKPVMPENIPSQPMLPSLIAVIAAALAGCATPGVTAAVQRDPARLQQVLDRPNHGNENLPNVLSNSISFDCADCVRLLLKAGVKPDANSLIAAVLSGREGIARLLVDAGADPAAAITVIHAQTRKWTAGAGISPQEAQSALAFFKKLDRERAAKSDEAAPAAPAVTLPAPVETKTPPTWMAPSFREQKRVDDYAFIVGIENYDDLPPATFAERDAKAAAEFVKALGVPASNVVTLTGARATRSRLAMNLEGWLADNVDENSTVYFYYAGLGAPDPKTGLAYLVPFDGDPQYLEATSYPLKRMYEKLGALKAKRVIVILDSSFSGAGGRSVLAKGAQPRAIGVDAGFNSADGKIALLAAADGDQAAGTNPETGYGLLTYHLFEGLNGAAKDASGKVTLKSLFGDLKPKVMDAARRAGRKQVPLFQSGGTATDNVILRGN